MINEETLFGMLKDEYYPDLTKVADQFSSYDCVSEQDDLYIELKCRKTHYDKLLIEKIKYDRIKELADMSGRIPVYICSTPEGIWEFNLDFVNLNWEFRDGLPTTTEFENKEKKSKVVGYLSVSKGRRLFPYYPEDNINFDEVVDDFAEDNWSDPMENEDIWDESNWNNL